MADSPLENVEMQRAVARFTTAVPIRDTLTDYQFAQYESAILGLCKSTKTAFIWRRMSNDWRSSTPRILRN